MKRFLAVLFTALAITAFGQATNILTLTDTVRLVWDANPERDLAGYNVFVLGPSPSSNTIKVTTVNTQVFLVAEVFKTNRPPIGIYRYWVTAFNTAGLESEPSSNLVENTGWKPSKVVNAVLTNTFEIK
jgi:hypothetical protein